MAFTPFPVRGPCPVAPTTRVRVQLRNSEGGAFVPPAIFEAKQLRWERFPDQKKPLPGDIVGYEVVSS